MWCHRVAVTTIFGHGLSTSQKSTPTTYSFIHNTLYSSFMMNDCTDLNCISSEDVVASPVLVNTPHSPLVERPPISTTRYLSDVIKNDEIFFSRQSAEPLPSPRVAMDSPRLRPPGEGLYEYPITEVLIEQQDTQPPTPASSTYTATQSRVSVVNPMPPPPMRQDSEVEEYDPSLLDPEPTSARYTEGPFMSAPSTTRSEWGTASTGTSPRIHQVGIHNEDHEMTDSDAHYDGATDNASVMDPNGLDMDDILYLRSIAEANMISRNVKQAIMTDAEDLTWDSFIQKYGPVGIRNLLRIFNNNLPEMFNLVEEMTLLPILKRIHTVLTRHRRRLYNINSIDHVVSLLQKSSRIVVISGAGVSVSCGLPDFRSKNGIYSRLGEFNLTSPTDMFDIKFFQQSPETFYSFARELYPSNFTPSPAHRFIKLLQDKGKLLRNYTQNIDALEQKAGIDRVVQCHGSFATCSCLRCHYQRPGNAIEEEIFAQKIPKCPRCPSETHALVKPDIVFFGEGLPDAFNRNIDQDQGNADLVLVIGSSLKVAPVGEMSNMFPSHVPQILINLEALPNMKYFDVQLLGYCDEIVSDLCRRLGWEFDGSEVDPPTFVAPNKYVYRGGVILDANLIDVKSALLESRRSLSNVRSRTSTTSGGSIPTQSSAPIAPTWRHVDSDQESVSSNQGNADEDEHDFEDETGAQKRKRSDIEEESFEKRHKQ